MCPTSNSFVVMIYFFIPDILRFEIAANFFPLVSIEKQFINFPKKKGVKKTFCKVET